ncbi:MAG: YfhO family protein [Anaerolineae bacterium]|nr:YfhO family protein [Anaerolineae bacterium]
MFRRHLPPLLLWTLLWLLFFAPLLLGRVRLPNSDFAGQFHAFAMFQAQEMGHGRFPIWSPGSFGGFPFAADPQSAAFYPPRWLTILAARPWGMPFYALEVEGLLHIWLTGVFTYGLAAHITRRRAAALLAAVAFALGGYLTSYPLLQLAVLETIAWLPLILLLLRLGVGVNGGNCRLRVLLAAGLIWGLAFLAGHPQTFLHLSYVVAAYYLFLAVRARWAWRWVVGIGVVVAGTAVGIALVAALPTWHYLALTGRSDTSYTFVASGQPLLLNLQLLLPGLLAQWSPEYVGVTAVTLAIVALYGRHTLPPIDPARSEILFWAWLTLIAAWLALGDNGILFELAYRAAPGFGLFRQQERLMGVVSLGLALLAAQGLALWLDRGTANRIIWRRTAVTLTLLLLLAALILWTLSTSTLTTKTLADWGLVWLRAGVLTAVTLALLLAIVSRPPLAWLLAVLLLLDLYAPITQAMGWQAESPGVFWPEPAWLAPLQADQPGRIDSRGLFHANLGELYGLQDIRGLSPLQWQVANRFNSLPRLTRWRLLHVTHVLDTAPVEPGMVEIASFTESVLPGEKRHAFLFRIPDPLPRAWMSYQPRLFPDAEAAWQAMKEPTFDPATQVMLSAALPDLETITTADPIPQVTATQPAPNLRQIQVQTAVPGILVISEWAQPGWQATVNGTAVPLLTVNYGLQGLLLPAGSHEIELRYQLPGLRAGLLVTAVTLLLICLLAWRWQPALTTRPPSPRRLRRPHPGVCAALTPSPPHLITWSPHHLVTATAVLLAAFALRLHTIAEQALRPAEAAAYLLAQGASLPMPVGEPLSPWLMAGLGGWLGLMGSSEWALRLPALYLGLLLLPLLAQLGRRIGGAGLGRLVLAITAVSPLLVWLSQDGIPGYAWSLLFAVAATLVVWDLLAGKRAGWWWLVYATLALLAVLGQGLVWVALLAHGLLLWLARVRPSRRAWVAWLTSVTAAGGVVAWQGWPLAENPTAVPEMAGYLVQLGRVLVWGEGGMAYGRWFFLAGLLLIVWGMRRWWRVQPGWVAFLAVWLGGMALAVYLLALRQPLILLGTVALAAPAWLLLLAMSLWALAGDASLRLSVSVFNAEAQGRREWKRPLAWLILLGLLLASLAGLHRAYTQPLYGRAPAMRELALLIQAAATPGDGVIAGGAEALPLAYYLADAPVELAFGGADVAWAQQHGRVWLLADEAEAVVNAPVAQWLQSNGLWEWQATVGTHTLSGYRLGEAVAAVLQPPEMALLDTAGEPLLWLRGVLVTVNGRPTTPDEPLPVTRGDTVAVTLAWEAAQPVPVHLTAFVHLLAADGWLVAQHDGVPGDGRQPTNEWLPGTTILDRHEFTVPPDAQPGTLHLAAGLYQTETVTRQVFADGRDAVVVGTVVVRP